MKMILAAATALTMSGAAIAQQTGTTGTHANDHNMYTQGMHGNMPHASVTLEPTRVLEPMPNWTAEQRSMYQQHMANYPPNWTAQQRADFQQQLRMPPAQWNAEQRAMYQQHFNNLPANWNAQQQAMYRQHMSGWQQPWASQQAMMGQQDQWAQQNQQSMSWSQQNMATMQSWAGMGGPYEEVYGDGEVSLQPRPATTNYPPCSPGPGDDNCIQLYERGVTPR